MRRVLPTHKVMDTTGYNRTTLWRKSRNPEDPFPVPVQLSGNRIAWFEDEIEAWLESRPRVLVKTTDSEQAAA